MSLSGIHSHADAFFAFYAGVSYSFFVEGTTKQLLMVHYENLEEVSKIEKYRQRNPSTYYETEWSKVLLHRNHEEDKAD